uniref:RING-type domain-containing protein n=1 Tax=Kalanchoe fedtschenkoi TaxID=63787 RepID=A0A7N0RF71_KALFE
MSEPPSFSSNSPRVLYDYPHPRLHHIFPSFDDNHLTFGPVPPRPIVHLPTVIEEPLGWEALVRKMDMIQLGHMCSVCLEDLRIGEPVILLPCKMHFYHEECIAPWMEIAGTCPNCRQPVVDVNSFDLTSSNEDDDDNDDNLELTSNSNSDWDELVQYMVRNWEAIANSF